MLAQFINNCANWKFQNFGAISKFRGTYMCLPPYDTGLNSGPNVCSKQESPPDTENWAPESHHKPPHTILHPPLSSPLFAAYFQRKEGGAIQQRLSRLNSPPPPPPPPTPPSTVHTSHQPANKIKQDVQIYNALNMNKHSQWRYRDRGSLAGKPASLSCMVFHNYTVSAHHPQTNL